jgi:hypothetical protein
MSMVDGCVLVVCSGADGQPLADWTDRTALDSRLSMVAGRLGRGFERRSMRIGGGQDSRRLPTCPDGNGVTDDLG